MDIKIVEIQVCQRARRKVNGQPLLSLTLEVKTVVFTISQKPHKLKQSSMQLQKYFKIINFISKGIENSQFQ